MNRLFREQELPGVAVDPDHTPQKHDSVPVREGRGTWRAEQRRRFITARRLDEWLISDWLHKRTHMNLPELAFEPVRSGLFFSLRLGGTWVAADWWLQYFEVDHSVTPLRLEHLHADLNQHLLPLLPAGTRPFPAPPRENRKVIAWPAAQEPFTAEDYARMATVNPRWTAWQHQIYGD